MCRKITSQWQPLFSKKMAAVASFSYKIGGAASFSNKIGGGKDLATLLAAVLTWSGYWEHSASNFGVYRYSYIYIYIYVLTTYMHIYHLCFDEFRVRRFSEFLNQFSTSNFKIYLKILDTFLRLIADLNTQYR